MTRDEILRRFPNASESTIAANYSRSSAVVEHHPRNESLAKNQSQEAATARLHIRFISARKRLCDPDNIAIKWLLDSLRYCKAIDGDEPEKITLEVGQRKVTKGESEHTVIEVYNDQAETWRRQ